MPTTTWTKIQGMSLARAARQVGFDITVYEDYNTEIQTEVRKQAIKQVLQELNDSYYYDTNRTLKGVKKGVYVICLSSPFAIKYPRGLSEIIYIGRGNVMGRLKSHFAHSLFPFMQSLSGADFDFYISEPKMPGPGSASEYFKHVEYLLLDGFKRRFGGFEREEWFPLLNNNAGSKKKLDNGNGWNKPLSRAGKTPRWALEPTRYWDFEKLD